MASSVIEPGESREAPAVLSPAEIVAALARAGRQAQRKLAALTSDNRAAALRLASQAVHRAARALREEVG